MNRLDDENIVKVATGKRRIGRHKKRAGSGLEAEKLVNPCFTIKKTISLNKKYKIIEN